LRVTTVEAATCQWCEQSPTQPQLMVQQAPPTSVQQAPPRPGSQDPNIIPLGKGVETSKSHMSHPLGGLDGHSPPLSKEWDGDLTKGASHWRGEKPQPRLGAPRLRDGNEGGDARGTQKCTTPGSALVVSQPSPVALPTATVTFGSNVEGPDEGSIPVTKPPFRRKSCATSGSRTDPLQGEPSGEPDLNHPIFARRQRREAPSSDTPRGMDLLRISRVPEMAGRRMVSDDPGSQRKSCMSATGIPLGSDVEDFPSEVLDTSETSGQETVTTADGSPANQGKVTDTTGKPRRVSGKQDFWSKRQLERQPELPSSPRTGRDLRKVVVRPGLTLPR
jgi:hypothetical protein